MNNLNYNDGIPEDKDRLCIFYDGDYFIDTFNNLSSSEQKQLLKWAYLPLIDKPEEEIENYYVNKNRETNELEISDIEYANNVPYSDFTTEFKGSRRECESYILKHRG